jgi:hypothetical protein
VVYELGRTIYNCEGNHWEFLYVEDIAR